MIKADNTITFLNNVKDIIFSQDQYSDYLLRESPTAFIVFITPSNIDRINPIILSVNEYFNMFGIKLNYSKSMKLVGKIQFSFPKFE